MLIEEFVIGNIDYIKKNQRKEMNVNLIMIQYHNLRQMKRCTLCLSCHTKNTYTKYYHDCDKSIWAEMYDFIFEYFL